VEGELPSTERSIIPEPSRAYLLPVHKQSKRAQVVIGVNVRDENGFQAKQQRICPWAISEHDGRGEIFCVNRT
jgi:hypothetical protein